MDVETSDQVLSRLAQAKADMKAICFGEGMRDKEQPEVMWSQYGLIDTNEIVVIARYCALEFAIVGPSPLIYPAMADRIFGMDLADMDFALSLADRLWPVVRPHIAA